MLTPGRKFVGDSVRLVVNFQDENRIDVDPATVKFKVMGPTGVVTTYTYGVDEALSKQDTGDYYVDHVVNYSGLWQFRWESTGTNKTAVVEGTFRVEYSGIMEGARDAYRS